MSDIAVLYLWSAILFIATFGMVNRAPILTGALCAGLFITATVLLIKRWRRSDGNE
jgi:hypothetical protein